MASAGCSRDEVALEQEVNSVLILMAMQAEAGPAIEHLGLKLDDAAFPKHAPCKCYIGKFGGKDVRLVTNGVCSRYGVDHIGTVAGSLAAWLSIERFHPDLVINAGTAGGFKREGAAIGDVFISSHMMHHDRRIAIPGFDEYGRGRLVALATRQMREALGFKLGVVSTGNSLDWTTQDWEVMEKNGAAVKDMEASGIAWICDLHDTPLFCIKVVTDIVDGDKPSHEEFLENLGAASKSLQAAIPNTLGFVFGRKLKDM